MKVQKALKCSISFLLSLCMISSFFITAMAAEESTPVFVSKEEASCIAEYFIQSMVGTDVVWTSETIICKETDLYSVDGTITAYSFDLDTNGIATGYIIISARFDMPNMILEFADNALPAYENLNISDSDKIIYSGVLDYYKALDNNEVETLDGDVVALADVTNDFEEIYNISYVGKNIELAEATCNAEDIFTFVESASVSDLVTAGSSVITDPYDYADENYVGPFSLDEWCNPYENYVPFILMSSFSGYSNHCGPTAILNLMETIGYCYMFPELVNSDRVTRFNQVAQLGISKGYFINGNGTYFADFDDYLEDAFSLFGISTTVTTVCGASYTEIKSQVDSGHPFCLGLVGHSYYKNHFVEGYAYCRLKSDTTGDYKSFVKIADGWDSSGRYIDITTIQGSSSAYIYEIVPNW